MPRIQISEPGKTPQPYKVKLDRETIKIGRAANNDVLLTDPSTSSNHCVIRRVEGGFILEDNKSTNGVKLDEQRFLKLDLNQDTDFLLGDVEVAFSFSDEEYDVLAEEDTFESEQQPMLPPSKEEKDKKRKKRASVKRKAMEAENEDISIEEDEEEEEEEKPRKRRSSSRASHVIAVDEEEDEDEKPRKKRSSSRVVAEDKDDFEDEDERPRAKSKNKPKPKASAPAPRRAQRIAAQNKSNPLVTILFVILCVIGFFAGLAIKHYVENKTFLLNDFLNKDAAPAAPVTPPPVTPPPTEVTE